jgi:mevalonate pyrophosphate decarboxylase
MPQKYFEPSPEDVISVLKELRQNYSGLYFGIDAITSRLLRTDAKYVKPVVDKLAGEGEIDVVEIQFSFFKGAHRHRAYRAKIDT